MSAGSKAGGTTPVRCPWAEGGQLYRDYHDLEWGVPVHDEQRLLEMLILEGAQAGLSWLTVLKKREAYRLAYAGFDPATVAGFGPTKVEELMANAGIVRNSRKIVSSIGNARCFLEIQKEAGSFDRYLWDFVGGRPVLNRWRTMAEVPARTELSDRISKDLNRRGFSFVGSTIVYAYLQAVGVVNDHLVGCFRQPPEGPHAQVQRPSEV